MRILLVVTALLVLTTAAAQASETVPVIEWDGRVDYATLGYLEKRLDEAVDAGAPILIWRLDSPGGELDAVRGIIELLRSSPLPVVIWVGPGGAVLGDEALPVGFAAAGLFGSESAVFGTGRPLTVTGGQLSELEPRNRAYLDELGALAAAEAERSSYNEGWAVLLARGLVSLTVWELETYDVGDGSADNPGELVKLLDGRPLNYPGHPSFNTQTWVLREIKTDILWEVLSFIVNPNVAFALFLFAMFAFAFTATNPGGFFTPVMGSVLLLVSLLAFDYLPLGWLGLLFVVASMVLFTLEVLLGTRGILAIFALGALFAGGLTFYSPGTTSVSLVVLVPSLAVTGVFFLIAVSGGLVAKLRAKSIGSGELVGELGVTTTNFGKRRRGKVKLKGDLWPATALAPLERGTHIRVRGIEGVHLLVEPYTEQDQT
ncbi:MAG TPA: NfeD family protein [bacterium]|nr:NfeD family protein [bacterium]